LSLLTSPAATEVIAVPNEAEVVVVASVVGRDDMVKEGVVVDREGDVDTVVDEGKVEVEVNGSLMLK
jgi:hypothetical protein